MPDYENILYEQDGPVVTITWNNPETLNAITPALEREFHDALDIANADPSARSIIFTGAGRAFSSGYNIAGSEGIESEVGGGTQPVSEHLERWFRFSSRNPDMMMLLMRL
ncbi:MAG: enoyl-CoA hydratase/isomerase family protein [Chloroflexi bacterium]|nr:enoyl-CoA hydratase/isomerase family protein [Chloroflexota bacterium]